MQVSASPLYGLGPRCSPCAPTARRAFTLVELLIVIIIIGILAAVAIPNFGSASQDAKLAALDQNLTCIRAAIELYYHQHNDQYPGDSTSTTHRATAAGAAAAHTDDADAFVKQLTVYSDTNGNTCAEKSANFPYGPYIRKAIPDNPLPAAAAADPGSVKVTGDATPLTADSSTGWMCSNETGEVIPNNPDYDDR